VPITHSSINGVDPGQIRWSLDFVLQLQFHLLPSINGPDPIELARLLAAFAVQQFAPTDFQTVLQCQELPILGISQRRWPLQYDLDASVARDGDRVPHDKVGDSELMLIVDGDDTGDRRESDRLDEVTGVGDRRI
jgi:hypothetical protein